MTRIGVPKSISNLKMNSILGKSFNLNNLFKYQKYHLDNKINENELF